jgi:hypothetical protein
MKQETVLRITGVGSAIACFMDSAKLAEAINAAFAKTDPEYCAVEVETDDGQVVFRRRTEGRTYSSKGVAEKFADKRYYADRERTSQYMDNTFKRVSGHLRKRR